MTSHVLGKVSKIKVLA